MARRRWSAALVLAGLVALIAPAADMPTTASASVPSSATASASAALAARPPMGVNNWNATGCTDAFDEAWVRAQADALVTTGLRDVGYRFVNLDDCWAAPRRDGAGRLVADPVRFPHGIAALAAYVHDRRLLLGIYTSAGTRTCDARGFPGSLGHERADAASFASWGVDYVKDDDCFTSGTDAPTRYAVMARALRETGRPVVLAVCDKGNSAPWRWAPGIAQLWRTTPDVGDDWASVSAIVRRSLPLAADAGPGGWNDPDMLEVGNGGLTADEERTQVAVWSVLAAPLLAGTDVATAAPATLALLGNRDLVAVDQDPLGLPPRVVADTGGVVVLDRTLSGGSVTAVVNLSDHAVPVGLTGRDLVTATALVPTTPLPPHATAMVRR